MARMREDADTRQICLIVAIRKHTAERAAELSIGVAFLFELDDG
jgi:hypothetical protein